MPRYIYKCSECKIEFQIAHSMNEELKDCGRCLSTDTLSKIPQVSFILKKSSGKVGKIVEENIVKSKEELQEMRDNLRKEL